MTVSSKWPSVATSSQLKEKMQIAKVLCVGAGGIGCELLKTLVLTGFEDIEVVDMDTIETSNLNRQFLFRKHHVGQSKAQVAAEAVRVFRPNAKIKVYQGNVKEGRFDKAFFQRFAVVLNGLDNVEARRHVNRLCLSAGTPLIESGTEGYLGQVTVHYRLKKGTGETHHATECFECTPKQSRTKTYPVCTIRNTPDKPIHCIVWAKELLFARLFGRPDVATDLDETVAGEEGAEANEIADDRSAVSAFQRGPDETAEAYAKRIFQHVFEEDILKVLSMEDLWETREKPKPLQLSEILASKGPALQDGNVAEKNITAAGESACKALGITGTHRVWSIQECAKVFVESITQYLQGRPAEVGEAVFDKEDDLAVEFVTAAANLRAANYNIPQQSLFITKGMAGNIIHAIATTNAIVSGLIVVEAMKILVGKPESSKATFILKHVTNPKAKRLLNAISPGEPSPKCAACGTARLELVIDTSRTSLEDLLNKVVKKKLSLVEPTLRTDEGFDYEEGEGLDNDEVEANKAKLPIMLDQQSGGGLQHGTVLYVEDQVQEFKVQIEVSHKEDWDEEQDPEFFRLGGSVPQATGKTTDQAGPSSAPGPSTAAAADTDDDDDLVMMDGPSAGAAIEADDDLVIVDEVKPPLAAAFNDKGKRPADVDAESPRKRQRGS